MSDRDVARLADQAGVTVLPLADYYAGRPNRCALLLGFAAFSEQATEAAIERLAGALRCPLNRGSGMSDRRSCF
jgi:GntR family transcriptional regulator / MocR family aminotransferase